MTKALKLANEIEGIDYVSDAAAAELRRLDAANKELLAVLWRIAGETYDDSAEKTARAAIAKHGGAA